MPWYVLCTKSRSEKKVAVQLRDRGIEVYCPLIRKKRKWSDRIKLVEVPLFHSYCFVKLNEYERHQVFGVTGIVRYLFWQNKPAIVRESEIDTIKVMLNDVNNGMVEIKVYSMDEQVKIASGHFAETGGKVVHQQGKELTLFIDSLQMVIKVDLSKTSISV